MLLEKHITAVILAAGQSKRMGTAKQLLPWGETTVLGQTIRQVKQADINEILVVVGHRADEVGQIAAQEGVATLYNPDYETGEMLSSLKTAVSHLQNKTDAVLVVLADQPMVEAQTLNAVISPFKQQKADLIAPIYKGRRGNPVLIGSAYFHDLLALPADDAPRTLLQRHRDKLLLIPVQSNAIHRDLDTPEAYEKWRPKLT